MGHNGKLCRLFFFRYFQGIQTTTEMEKTLHFKCFDKIIFIEKIGHYFILLFILKRLKCLVFILVVVLNPKIWKEKENHIGNTGCLLNIKFRIRFFCYFEKFFMNMSTENHSKFPISNLLRKYNMYLKIVAAKK